ncbi:MAG: hypothetical protein WAT39_20350 [Planctomycetota bacterium]
MFLPLILAFVGLFAAAASGAALPGNGALQGGTSQDRLPKFTVAAGTGEVDVEWLEQVRGVVAAELPALLQVFGGRPDTAFFVFVHADRDGLPETLRANLHADCPGFALLGQHQVHLVRAEIRRLGVALPAVVRHELVHELLDQYVAPHGRRIPRWFHEGLAQHLAGDTYLRASEDDLVWRIGSRRLRPFAELETTFPEDTTALRLAYAQSSSYVSFLARRYGVGELLAAARAVDGLTGFGPALAGRLGRSTYDLGEDWREHVLHASGAPWRVAFDQCFTLTMVAALPLLALALIRRLQREQRVRRQMIVTEAMADAAAAEASPDAAAAQANPDTAAAAEALAPLPTAPPPERGRNDETSNPDNTIESRPPPG